MKKLPKQNLNDLFAAISAQQALYLPADDAAGQAQFTLWRDGMTLSRRHNTARSAKDLFFRRWKIWQVSGARESN